MANPNPPLTVNVVYVWPFIPMRRYGTNIIISWKRLANSYRELHIQIDKISKNGNVCRFLLPWLNEIIVKFCFGSTCMHKANYHHIVIFDYFAIFYRSFSICTKLNSCWVWVLWVYYSTVLPKLFLHITNFKKIET